MARTELAKRPAAASPPRRGPSPKIAKLERQLASTRKAGKTKLERQGEQAQVATLLAALTYGIINRKGIELPYVGDLGTAAAAGGLVYAAGAWRNSAWLRQFGLSLGAMGLSEFVEDSSMLSFLD